MMNHVALDETDKKIEDIGKVVKRLRPMTNLIGDEIEKQGQYNFNSEFCMKWEIKWIKQMKKWEKQ